MTIFNIYQNDILNRFPGYTLTDTISGDKLTWTLKDSGNNLVQKYDGLVGKDSEVLRKLRVNLGFPESILLRSTTAQKNALVGVEDNQTIFDTDLNQAQVFNGTSWIISPQDTDSLPEGSTNLYYPQADKDKLAGIEALAEVNTINSGDNVSQLVNDVPYLSTISGGDHTSLSNIGTNTHAQLDSHVADSTIHFTAASLNLDNKEDKANKGTANGYTPLDGSSLVSLVNLPDSVKTGSEYRGCYDAATNTPTLVNGTGSNGDYYRVCDAGSQDFGAGSISFLVGDIVVYDGTLTTWDRIAGNPDLVQSVAGKQGIVTLVKADVGLGNVDNTSDLDKPVSTAQQTEIDTKEDSFSKNTAFNKNFGSASGDVCEGDDSRLSDARTPLAHTHLEVDITNLDKYTQLEVDNLLTGKEDSFTKNTAFNNNYGTAAGTVAQGNDARLSDARTPTSHAASHTDGSDDIQSATVSQKGLMTAAQATTVSNQSGTNTGDQDLSGLVEEAPEDGKQYARKDAGWEEVQGGFTLSFDVNDAIFPSSNPASASSRNDHPIAAYNDSTAENLIFLDVIPNNYDGSNITVDIDWVADTATSGGVTWGVEFERNAPGGNDIDSSSFASQQTGNSTTNATSGIITRTSITLTQAQADSIAASDYFRMRLERVTGDGGDNMSNDAQILKVSVRV